MNHFSADNLTEIFSEFNKLENLTPDEKLAIEELKLALITATRNQLAPLKPDAASSTPTAHYQALRWLSFILLMLVEIGPMFISGLLFANLALQGLMFVIPALTVIGTPLGIACVANSLTGFTCLIIPIIKDWLGVASSKTRSLPIIYQEQLTGTREIQTALLQDNSLSSAQYQEYSKMALVLNTSMKNLQKKPPKNKKSIGLWIIESILLGLSAVYFFSNAIFGAASLLGLFSHSTLSAAVALPALIASLPASLMIGITLIIFVASFTIAYRLKNMSIMSMLNPDAAAHTHLTKELKTFEAVTNNKFKEILDKKRRLEYKPNRMLQIFPSRHGPYQKITQYLSGPHTQTNDLVSQSGQARRCSI